MGCSYGRFLLGVRGASWSGSLVPSLQGSGKRSCCSEAFAEQILADFEQKNPDSSSLKAAAGMIRFGTGNVSSIAGRHALEEPLGQ